MKNKIFVIYYHKILPKFGFDVYYKTFDLELKIIKKLFNVISLEEAYWYITEKKQPEKPSIVITFDDGYADNFVYAYPLLKKHQLKATIFPVSSRILREDKVRPTLEDYWKGRVSFNELYRPKTMAQANYEFLTKGWCNDFLTISELNKMKDVFEIGGHAKIHAKVFYSEQIKDFYDGNNGHWSLPYSYSDSYDFSKLENPSIGFPIFPDKNNLAVKRGYLKKQVKEFIRSIDKDFFRQKDWKQNLQKELEKNFASLLEFETDQEREKRIRWELETSKRELEELTGERIKHFSYPFGHYDQFLKSIVKDYFDTAYTTEKGIINPETEPDNFSLPRIAIAKDFFSFIDKIVRYGILG